MLSRVAVFALGFSLAAGCSGSGTEVSTAHESASCTCKLDLQIENLAVCVSPSSAFNSTLVYSSHVDVEGTGPDGKPQLSAPKCEPARGFPQPVPKDAWSRLRISSPCAGRGRACIAFRQGEANVASDADCTFTRQCVDFDYQTPNQIVDLPSLMAWSAEDQACAERYEAAGGYIEAWLEESELGCSSLASAIKRVQTCPVGCDLNPSGPGCDVCGSSTVNTSF